MCKEVIRPIKDFPGYFISNKGNVFSAWKRNGRRPATNTGRPQRKLNPSTQKYGHKLAMLRKDGLNHYRWIHRLVLETFVGPCPEGKETCHNDGNPSNNNVSNLRWDSHSANLIDAKKHGTLNNVDGERNPMSKLTAAQIHEIRFMARKRILLQREIADKFGIHEETVGRIHRRKRWAHLE